LEVDQLAWPPPFTVKSYLRTLVLEAQDRAGGIATRARGLENYPGFQKISGLRLMEKIVHQAEKNGVERALKGKSENV
jgi:thioredoxin reductase